MIWTENCLERLDTVSLFSTLINGLEPLYIFIIYLMYILTIPYILSSPPPPLVVSIWLAAACISYFNKLQIHQLYTCTYKTNNLKQILIATFYIQSLLIRDTIFFLLFIWSNISGHGNWTRLLLLKISEPLTQMTNREGIFCGS